MPPKASSHNGTISNQVKILGIDIDATLIDRANEKNKSADITYKCLDIMEQDAMRYLRKYLIEILKNTSSTNVTDNEEMRLSTEVGEQLSIKRNALKVSNFDQSDFLEQNNSGTKPKELLEQSFLNKFSIVFCFSVTMWIHLNHGDSGLYEFLRKIVALGKYLVLENQPWRCYRKAQRRMVKQSIKEKKNVSGDNNESCDNRKYAETPGDINQAVEKSSDGRKYAETPDDINKVVEKSSDGIMKNSKELEVNDNKIDKSNTERRNEAHYRKREKSKDTTGRDRGREKKEPEELGFRYFRQLKLRSDVDEQIDAFLREKCAVRKLFKSEENEWGRVITVYEVL